MRISRWIILLLFALPLATFSVSCRSIRPVDLHAPAATSAPADPPAYRIRALKFSPLLINDRGEIVTTIATGKLSVHSMKTDEPALHLGLWKNGKLHDLGNLPNDDNIQPVAINDRGEILGFAGEYAMLPGDYEHSDSFLWSQGRLHLISKTAYVNALNNQGQVTGENDGSDGQQAFIYQDGILVEVPNPIGGHFSEVTGINDKGEMVGVVEAYTDPHKSSPTPEMVPIYSYLWSGGKAVVLPNAAYGEHESFTNLPAINNSGLIVEKDMVPIAVPDSHEPGGVLETGRDTIFVWQGEKWTPIDLLPGWGEMEFVALNDQGEIIGHAEHLLWNGNQAPFLWRNGHTYDLNSLLAPGSGWKLDQVYGLNNRGQIVGVGEYRGEGAGFLMTPVTRKG